MAISFNRFVVREAICIAAFNAVIDASYTWWLWHSLDPLTLFGDNAIGFNIASTPVWIAVLSTLLGTSAIRRKLRDGRVDAPDKQAPADLGMMPQSIVLRSAFLGTVGALVLSLPLGLFLHATGFNTLSLSAAILMKVAITVPLSLVIVPVVILAALADVRPASRAQLVTA